MYVILTQYIDSFKGSGISASQAKDSLQAPILAVQLLNFTRTRMSGKIYRSDGKYQLHHKRSGESNART